MTLTLQHVRHPYMQEKEAHFSLHQGDIMVVVGDNGTGKSTLLRLIAGEIMPTQGGIYAPERVFLVEQHIDRNLFPELTVAEHLALFCPEAEMPASLSWTQPYTKKIKDFSGGEKQIILFELLAARPYDLLLLDEPTSALSPAMAERMMGQLKTLLRTHGMTCVLITHDHRYRDFGNRLLEW